jgi:1-acyl-sn-glycerol-3-phosphate acyltransferase
MEHRVSADGGLPPLPPAMPQFPPHPLRRACAWLLRRCGWRVVGEFPDRPRLVVIAAPHSSWWDGVWGLLCKVALGADITFMAKRELFRGPLGWLLRRLGGIPIERAAAHGLVEQMVARFRASPQLWLGIAPEGTRKHVHAWKSGFWHIARAAEVPILPAAFDYPSRTITIGPLFQPSADLHADLAALRAFYAPFRGKHRNA